ncbi:hypothetical protein [Synechococcus phage S-8S56]|nr:hypothetical protein [Synechococcus phage S-8S56]
MTEPITVEDYKLVSDEFFQKYNYAAERMGPGPQKAEDVLKVMEALTGAVLKERVKDKLGPFGFNKRSKTDG